MVRFRDADLGQALSGLATSPHCGLMEAGESGTQTTCSPGWRGDNGNCLAGDAHVSHWQCNTSGFLAKRMEGDSSSIRISRSGLFTSFLLTSKVQ